MQYVWFTRIYAWFTRIKPLLNQNNSGKQLVFYSHKQKVILIYKKEKIKEAELKQKTGFRIEDSKFVQSREIIGQYTHKSVKCASI